MTREEIIAKWDGLAPRERDAWVAEVVFGWRDASIVGNGAYAIPPGYEYSTIPVPQYTTDISAAWSVQDQFFACRIEGLGNSGYECEIFNEYGISTAFVRNGEYIAPEAIGLAAILAKLSPTVRFRPAFVWILYSERGIRNDSHA